MLCSEGVLVVISVGHTACSPEVRQRQSQAGPKGQLQVGPQRAPRLLFCDTEDTAAENM